MCIHHFVNENGYSCCTNCGEAKNIHYWSEDYLHDVIIRILPIHHYSKNTNYSFNRKWKHLMRMNKIYGNKTNRYINEEILKILNLFPLSHEVKGNIYSYMMGKEFSSYNEVCKTFYELICVNDLPITSKEFIKILQAEKKTKFKLLTKLNGVENARKYYWYITKQIEKARNILNFSHEEGQEIYKIVLDYYNLIRFKLLKSANPTYLIHNLVYYTVRERLHPNQQCFSKKSFEIENCSFVNRLVKYLKELKRLNLDSHLPIKLNISSRNKRLEASI